MSIPVGTADVARAAKLPSGRVDEIRGAALPGAGIAPAADAVAAPAGTVEDAVKAINESLQGQAVGVRFEVDGATDRMVVKVVDRDSGEVIRQMPSEAVLRLALVLGQASGTLVSQVA